MGAVLYPLHDVHGYSVVLVVLLGMAVYAAAVIMVRAMTREEIAFLRSALGRQT
jgi:hypothetical protein